MPRPRDPNVLEEVRDCPVHGLVAHRLHRHGRRANGAVKYTARCPDCHATRVLGDYHRNRS